MEGKQFEFEFSFSALTETLDGIDLESFLRGNQEHDGGEMKAMHDDSDDNCECQYNVSVACLGIIVPENCVELLSSQSRYDALVPMNTSSSRWRPTSHVERMQAEKKKRFQFNYNFPLLFNFIHVTKLNFSFFVIIRMDGDVSRERKKYICWRKLTKHLLTSDSCHGHS